MALRLKAGEPVVWIESVDDDWIVEGVKRIVGAWGDCRVVEKIDFEAVDMGESKRRVVWVWQGAMQADISVAEKALLTIFRMTLWTSLLIYTHCRVLISLRPF